ncbi:MAG: YdeI/OmpD-associated family protein [Gemmatimonadota bacterium]
MALIPRDVTYFEVPADFRSWLEAYASEADQLWVGYWKKATGRASVTWEETVDEALCYGWIDGIRKRVDDDAYTIRFTPRRPRSIWSNRNLERYAVLSREGLIEPSGRAAFERRTEARTGVYSFEQETPSELSADYVDRLRANEAAWSDWDARPPGYRRRAAHWVMSAKRNETRDRRMAALIADSAVGRKVKPFR